MDQQLVSYVNTILRSVENEDEFIMEIEFGYIRQLQFVKLNLVDEDPMKSTVTITGVDYFHRDFLFRDIVFALVQGRLTFDLSN